MCAQVEQSDTQIHERFLHDSCMICLDQVTNLTKNRSRCDHTSSRMVRFRTILQGLFNEYKSTAKPRLFFEVIINPDVICVRFLYMNKSK